MPLPSGLGHPAIIKNFRLKWRDFCKTSQVLNLGGSKLESDYRINFIEKIMMKLFFMLILGPALFAQQQVYNVQKYCIDEKPIVANQCDITGNEYSFVFIDTAKMEVTLFLSTNKFKYQIVETKKQSGTAVFNLKDDSGSATMTIRNEKTIEFIQPDRRIKLTVGSSTKT